jgi:hypothetical protein
MVRHETKKEPRVCVYTNGAPRVCIHKETERGEEGGREKERELAKQ